MKKVLSLLLALGMCLSLCACGASKTAKVAYDNINIAYEIIEQFGSDIYEAWRLSIYEQEEFSYNGIEHLADELSLNSAELRTGFAYCVATKVDGKKWDEVSEDDKKKYIDTADDFFKIAGDVEGAVSSLCIFGVVRCIHH